MECSFRIDLNPFLWRWKVIQAFFAGTKSHQLWWQLLRWGRPLGAKNYGWRKTLHHSTWKAQCSVAFFYQNWSFSMYQKYFLASSILPKNEKVQYNSMYYDTSGGIVFVGFEYICKIFGHILPLQRITWKAIKDKRKNQWTTKTTSYKEI